jgi:hypothetical protein
MSPDKLVIGLLLFNLWLWFGVWTIVTVASEVVIHVGPIACLASLVFFPITWSVGPFAIGLAWEEWSAARRLGLSALFGGLALLVFGFL